MAIDYLTIERLVVACPHCGNPTDVDVKFYDDNLSIRNSWSCQATYSMGQISCFKKFVDHDLTLEEQIVLLKINQQKFRKYHENELGAV